MAWPATSARSKNWGTEILTDADLESELDLLHTYLNDMLNSSSGHKHDGTTAEGPKLLTANIDDAAGTAGDMYTNTGGTTVGRIALGAANQVLAVNSGATAVEYQTPTTAASQAEQETGTETAKYVAPATAHHHQSSSKAWANVNSDGTLLGGYNCTTARNSAGNYTVTWITDFSDTLYAPIATAQTSTINASVTAIAVGTCTVILTNSAGGVSDSDFYIVAFGDQ